MQKKLLPMLLAVGLFGCQTHPTISQTKPAEPIIPSESAPSEIMPPKKEPVICTMQYDPICATINDNGVLRQQTFGNACSAGGTDNIISMTKGECSHAATQ